MWTGKEVPRCPGCGCTDVRLLEVNHVNGGGGREAKAKGDSNKTMYADIAMGRRGVEDLDIRCRPCNAVHYLELKYPDVKGRLVVAWLPAVVERTVPCEIRSGEVVRLSMGPVVVG